MAPLLIIDPGHGGIDPGGGSNQLFKESQMVLQISLYQYQRFQALNVDVAITRTSDKTLSSSERAQIVRNSGAKYCISNHINAGGGHGAEAIYSIYGSGALPTELLAELETEGMPSRRVYTRTLPNNPTKDYYFMHRETGSVETIILEYGFADNTTDAQKINTDWRDLAEAVVRGFCQFVGHAYQPPGSSGTSPVASPAPTPTPASSTTGSTTAQPASGQEPSSPEWKTQAIDWLYQQGLLTSDDWRDRIDEPLPLWAEAVLLRRLFQKLQNQ
ncbi:N-acetylmuramoyl-L-alanine amidase family protein [Brevibacillus fulvus]|uniref:N-acetylmuramoyl-L-alanine amidase n=1 Tax=Brevibacillus fulvus TaxID=1125967 RepID=A0A939BRT7_9BACL|nr:N-acetylmuramoyl-L-alanine amidase [Brevibacillus fulvus]MBM7589788.1 N-acetylmuramoyl-L-alanine amidase [Brevibacillus fulvus]